MIIGCLLIFLFYNCFIFYGCALGLGCYHGLFSSWERLLFSYRAQASHCSSYSCCGAWTLKHVGFSSCLGVGPVIVVHGLSGVLQVEMGQVSLHWQSGLYLWATSKGWSFSFDMKSQLSAGLGEPFESSVFSDNEVLSICCLTTTGQWLLVPLQPEHFICYSIQQYLIQNVCYLFFLLNCLLETLKL